MTSELQFWGQQWQPACPGGEANSNLNSTQPMENSPLRYSPHWYAKCVNNQWAGVLNFHPVWVEFKFEYCLQPGGEGRQIFREETFIFNWWHEIIQFSWFKNMNIVIYSPSWNSIIKRFLFKTTSITNHVEELKGLLSALHRNKPGYLTRKVKDTF